MDIKQMIEDLHNKYIQSQGDNGTLKGLENVMKSQQGQSSEGIQLSTETPKGYAQGGAVPPMSDMMTSINSTPPTNYDFYKDISSEDRAKLAQQLMQQQHSGGMLAGQAVAGIGDAIQNSYGGKSGVNGMGAIQNKAQANTDQQLGAFDTQRSQRMQDMSGNQEMMMNDPNHPLANSMREMLKSQGVNVPSGMNSNLMVKVLGPMGELALKQATLGVQTGQAAEAARHNKSMEGQQATETALATQKEARDAADKTRNIALEADKETAKHNFAHPFQAAAAQKRMSAMGAQTPATAPISFPGEKEARYEAWKASQGR